MAAPAFAQTEIETSCFCRAGNNLKQFSAEIELTNVNRAAVRKMIEAGDLDLRQTIKIRGNGFVPADWRKNRLRGQTSVTTTKPVVLADESRRLAYAVVEGQASHRNAAVQVRSEGDGCRIVWTIDLLPNELTPAVGAMMDRAAASMTKTLAAA